MKLQTFRRQMQKQNIQVKACGGDYELSDAHGLITYVTPQEVQKIKRDAWAWLCDQLRPEYMPPLG